MRTSSFLVGRLLVILLAVSSLTALVACSGSDEGIVASSGSGGATGTGARSVEATYAEASAAIETNCAVGICHGGTLKPLLTIDEELPSLLLELEVPGCGDQPLVVPGDPEGSAMMMMIRAECGESLAMPQGCSSYPCVSEADIATLESWIEAGALSE